MSQFVRRGIGHTTKQLLPDKNSGWLADDESPLTEDEFTRRLTLQGITIDRAGGALSFDDGKLFFYHAIITPFGPDGLFEDAYLAG